MRLVRMIAPGLLPPLVLVVDDHDDSRVIARLVLEAAGFRVAEASTGSEGLRRAFDAIPTAVLLDMVLPELDGWETARRMRADPRTKDVAIIAVTALSWCEDHSRALLAGCDEVLTKPVRPRTLLDTLERYIGLPIPPRERVS